MYPLLRRSLSQQHIAYVCSVLQPYLSEAARDSVPAEALAAIDVLHGLGMKQLQVRTRPTACFC